MRAVWIMAIVCTGFVNSKPYYYKESKQSTEHHKEYSYSGLESHGPPEAGQEVDLYPEMERPEKYVSSSYPALSSSAQSYSGGSAHHGSYFHSPILAPHMPGESIQQYTTPEGGNVIVKKVVKVIRYPGTSSSNYFQISRHSSGSGGLEHLGSISNVDAGSLLGEKEAHFNNDESSGHGYVPISNINGARHIRINKVVTAEHKELHGIGTPEITQTRHSFSLNRNPNVEDAEIIKTTKPLKYVNIGSGQTELYSGGYNKKSEGLRQHEDSLHSIHHQGGRKLVDSQAQHWLGGQQEMSLESLSQKEENLHPGYPHLEVGQEEVSVPLAQQSLDLHFGQKEEQHFFGRHEVNQKENSYYPGQQPEKIEIGQKEVSLYPRKDSEILEVGQKEESLHPNQKTDSFEVGQHEESIYPGQQSISTELGQKEETIHIGRSGDKLELGQKEDSLYPGHNSEGLELGQKEERLYLEQQSQNLKLGQKEENLYPGQESENLELGQKEESLYPGQESEKLELGQKEESIYPGQESENLELGQKEESLYPGQESEKLELGEKEESIYPGQESENLELGQKEESLYPGQESENLELGQKETSLYPGQESENLELGQKEENLEADQKIERLHHAQDNDDLELGQKEVSLYDKVDNLEPLGQKEESLYLSPSSENVHLGQSVHTSHPSTGNLGQSYKHSSFSRVIELGQQELPSNGQKNYQQMPYVNANYKKEVSQYLIPGQKEERLTLENPKEVISINKPSPKEESGQQVVNEHSVSGKREHSLYQSVHTISKEGTRDEPILSRGDTPYNHGINNHRYVCKHNHLYTHGGFGVGQRGHDLQISQFERNNGKTESDWLTHVNDGGRQKERLDIGQQEEPEQDSIYLGLGQEVHQRGDLRQQPSKDLSSSYASSGSRFVENNGRMEFDKHLENARNVHGITTHESHYYEKRSNLTASQINRNLNDQIHRENVQSQQQKASAIMAGTHNSGSAPEFNFNKKLDDLALEIQLEGLVKTSTPTDNLHFNNKDQTKEEETPRASPLDIHIAEIQELGLENLNNQRTEVTPVRRVNVFETHSEEVGLNHQPIRKTYSKKHSRHSSVVKEETRQSQPLQFGEGSFHISEPGIRRVSGGSYSYEKSFSSHNGNDYIQSDQPVQRQTVSGTEFFGNNQQTDRHAAIDEFLTELDKDIAGSGGRRTQTGYVQVSSQQQPSVRTSGSSMYSQSSYSSGHSSSGSSSTGGSSWYKRLGDNINTQYNNAKNKAKEIVETVKQKVSSY